MGRWMIIYLLGLSAKKEKQQAGGGERTREKRERCNITIIMLIMAVICLDD